MMLEELRIILKHVATDAPADGYRQTIIKETDEAVTPQALAALLQQQYPSRFRPAGASFHAQNLASSEIQAGHLHGNVRKRRAKPRDSGYGTAFVVERMSLSQIN
jgi:hypothetical protein